MFVHDVIVLLLLVKQRLLVLHLDLTTRLRHSVEWIDQIGCARHTGIILVQYRLIPDGLWYLF